MNTGNRIIVIIDTNILGRIVHPNSRKFQAEKQWLRLLANKVEFVVPEIVDYELRRSLECEKLKNPQYRGLEDLDRFLDKVTYLPIATEHMRLASNLWATARAQGQSTQKDSDLGGDPILAAQARSLFAPDADVIVATTNRKHLQRYGVDARGIGEIEII